jgi:hypothetical protein
MGELESGTHQPAAELREREPNYDVVDSDEVLDERWPNL